jgi:hypothetical protein
MGDARPDFGVQTQGTDSGMASEAIEIAQNGLGQRRSAGSESQRESIRRILNKLAEQKTPTPLLEGRRRQTLVVGG